MRPAARTSESGIASYLLDANVFIQAKNLHYGLDFCPAFWQWLIDNNDSNRVFSIDKVGDELAAGSDALTDWASQHGQKLFRKTDAAVAAQFGQVSTWVTGQQYEPTAVNTFLQVADFYLIAHALAGGHVVVTHEIAANTARKIKIPNVCSGLGLRFRRRMKCFASRGQGLYLAHRRTAARVRCNDTVHLQSRRAPVVPEARRRPRSRNPFTDEGSTPTANWQE